jgi:hypothetical protein
LGIRNGINREISSTHALCSKFWLLVQTKQEIPFVRCFSILFGIETFTILKPCPRGGIINVDHSTWQKWILRKNVLVLSLDHATHVGSNLDSPRAGSVESFCCFYSKL